MSRWKKLDDLEDKWAEMTVQELEAEVVFWRRHADQLQPKIRKLAMKTVHRVQRTLERKRLEEQ